MENSKFKLDKKGALVAAAIVIPMTFFYSWFIDRANEMSRDYRSYADVEVSSDKNNYGNNLEILAGDSFYYTARGFDPDGISSAEVYFGSNKITGLIFDHKKVTKMNLINPIRMETSNLIPGKYDLEFKIFDSQGEETSSFARITLKR